MSILCARPSHSYSAVHKPPEHNHPLQVTSDEGVAFCKQRKLFFIETSALDDTNVSKAFETLLKEIYGAISKQSLAASAAYNPTNSKPIVVNNENATAASSSSGGRLGGCCS